MFQPLLGSEMPWRGSKWDKCVGVREGRTWRGAKTGSTWQTVEGPWPCLRGQVTCISSGQNIVISIYKRVVEKVGHMEVGFRMGDLTKPWKRKAVEAAERWLKPYTCLWKPDGKPLIWDLANNRNTGKKKSVKSYCISFYLFYSVKTKNLLCCIKHEKTVLKCQDSFSFPTVMLGFWNSPYGPM